MVVFLWGEAGFSAPAQLAGDGRREVHVRGHATRVAALLPPKAPKVARVSSAADVLQLRQATRRGRRRSNWNLLGMTALPSRCRTSRCTSPRLALRAPAGDRERSATATVPKMSS